MYNTYNMYNTYILYNTYNMCIYIELMGLINQLLTGGASGTGLVSSPAIPRPANKQHLSMVPNMCTRWCPHSYKLVY